MIRPAGERTGTIRRIPRASGDDPANAYATGWIYLYSPRERG